MFRWRLAFIVPLAAMALAAVFLGAGPALAAAWTVAPSPPAGQDAYINGISARTDADAWAVGSVGQQSSKVGSLPLIESHRGQGCRE